MRSTFKIASDGSYLSDFHDARFNQDSSCLAVSCTTGFRIYNCNPFSLATNRDLSSVARGNVTTVEMMYRCNIIAIVGDYDSDTSSFRSLPDVPMWQRNVLILWDDKDNCEVAQLVFGSAITNVKLLRNLLFVTLEKKLYVYQLHTVKLLDTFITSPNAHGICAVSGNDDLHVVAFPGTVPGSIIVKLYHFDGSDGTLLGDESVMIRAHKSDITAIGLSVDGFLLVTSSKNGRLVRLWSAFSGIKLQEFRKAGDGGILRICHISPDSRYLCTVSTTEVVSIFNIRLRCHAKRCSKERLPIVSTDSMDSPTATDCLPLRLFRHTRIYWETPTAYTRFRSPAPVVASTFMPNTNNLLLVLANGRVHRLSVAGHFNLLANHAL
ncbi:hypothetical protein BaOVIS_030090 [Babesia ovis]|uniref:Uncharacterized protein n=1 Tax=Babesia ovis TaxID=5869 RepID=A0A9W5WW02_BABOV|nr:hypothetical protein BaOVIS_030090 [Babesia ovis]